MLILGIHKAAYNCFISKIFKFQKLSYQFYAADNNNIIRYLSNTIRILTSLFSYYMSFEV